MPATIPKSWARISTWLKANAPDALTDAGPAVTTKEVDSAAKKMAVKLHADHVKFCQIINGAESSGIFPAYGEWEDMAFSPMSLDDSTSAWEMLKQLLELGEFTDRPLVSVEGVANDFWNVAWIPFADNGGGDYYCIDMAPGKGGKKGQVIFHSHESGQHVVLATSLRDYLSQLADNLDAGRLEYDEDYGIKTPEPDE